MIFFSHEQFSAPLPWPCNRGRHPSSAGSTQMCSSHVYTVCTDCKTLYWLKMICEWYKEFKQYTYEERIEIPLQNIDRERVWLTYYNFDPFQTTLGDKTVRDSSEGECGHGETETVWCPLSATPRILWRYLSDQCDTEESFNIMLVNFLWFSVFHRFMGT